PPPYPRRRPERGRAALPRAGRGDRRALRGAVARAGRPRRDRGRLAGLGRPHGVPRPRGRAGLVHLARVPRDPAPAHRERDLGPRARRLRPRRVHRRRLRGGRARCRRLRGRSGAGGERTRRARRARRHGALMTATGTVSRRVGFAVAVVASTLMMAAASAPSPFYPDLEARFDATPAAMTAVFAIYAVVLLGALLTAGSLSDHVGRRPVLSAGFVLLAVSVVAFGHAGSVAGLLVARSLQGLASGVLLSALAATITELEPAHRRGSGAVWNSLAPLVGLAVGATVGGAALTVTPARAMGEVFGALGVAYAVLAAAVWVAPETSPRHEGWRT